MSCSFVFLMVSLSPCFNISAPRAGLPIALSLTLPHARPRASHAVQAPSAWGWCLACHKGCCCAPEVGLSATVHAAPFLRAWAWQGPRSIKPIDPAAGGARPCVSMRKPSWELVRVRWGPAGGAAWGCHLLWCVFFPTSPSSYPIPSGH